MDFLEKRKEQLGVQSLNSLKNSGKVNTKDKTFNLVKGIEHFDCLKHGWSRKELLGVIADSGVGKTEFVLMNFAQILLNNPKSVAVFVSLEMTTEKIASRWEEITENNPELGDRLYIVSRYGDDGKPKDVSVEWIQRELKKIRDVLGDIVVFAIDHLHVMGDNDVASLNSICIKVKEMCVENNAFGMLLAQVGKGAGQKGEVPLDTDSVYGCSQFKWIVTDAIQLHRPILRYEDEAKMSVLAYGYCKIREPSKEDKIKRSQNKLLKYNLESRTFVELKNEDYSLFKIYYNDLLSAKEAEEKNKAHEYSLVRETIDKNGNKVKVTERFSGDIDHEL